jgi:hypothetical protein
MVYYAYYKNIISNVSAFKFYSAIRLDQYGKRLIVEILRKDRVYFKHVMAGYIEEIDEGYRYSHDESYLRSPSAHTISKGLCAISCQ